MVSVREQLADQNWHTNDGHNPVEFVTIHETANQSNGANAAAHANLLSKKGTKSSSWHATADEKEVVVSYTDDARCWHAGTPNGNNSSYGIEICVNADGNFAGAVENAAEFAASKLRAHGRGIERLVQHNKWTGKNCPTFLRSGSKGIYWSDFVNKVNGYLTGTVPVDNPVTPPPSAPLLVIDGIRGPATITKWQQVLGTYADGVISKPVSNLIKADQTFLNSVVAPEHIVNLTGKSSLDVDGDEGEKTIITRQFWLRNAVNPVHQQNLIGHPLDFDGILGPETNKVHQFALNHATAGSKTYGRV